MVQGIKGLYHMSLSHHRDDHVRKAQERRMEHDLRKAQRDRRRRVVEEFRRDNNDYHDLDPSDPGDGHIVRKKITDDSLWEQ